MTDWYFYLPTPIKNTKIMFSLTKLQWRLKSEPIKGGPTLNVTVNLNMTSKIESVACPNIKLAVDLPDRPTETSVAFKLENTDADQDLIFSASLVEPHKYAYFFYQTLQDPPQTLAEPVLGCKRTKKVKWRQWWHCIPKSKEVRTTKYIPSASSLSIDRAVCQEVASRKHVPSPPSSPPQHSRSLFNSVGSGHHANIFAVPMRGHNGMSTASSPSTIKNWHYLSPTQRSSISLASEPEWKCCFLKAA